MLRKTLHPGAPDLGFLILDFLASGMTAGQVLDDYPQVSAEDIRACVAYASEMTREHVVDTSARIGGA